MPPLPKRVWDSVVIIDYLVGTARAAHQCPAIISEAEQGLLEIVFSAAAETEVAKLDGYADEDAELRIREFFSRRYVRRANHDVLVSEFARGLIRDYPRLGDLRKVTPRDAVQVATALRWKIPVFETFDDKLIERILAEPHKLPRPLILRNPTASSAQATLWTQQPELFGAVQQPQNPPSATQRS